MKARHVWVGVAVGLLALTGCGSGNSDSKGQSPAPATSTVTVTATGTVSQQAYLAALAALDQGLVVNKDRAISRGENVCADIKAGKDNATVVKNAVSRFDGGNASVDEAKAKLIVQVIQSTKFCG